MALLLGYINGDDNSSPNGYTEGPSWSYFGGITGARICSDGVRRVVYTAMGMRLAGRGANRSARLYIADSDGGGLAHTPLLTINSGSSSNYENASITKYSIGDGRSMRAGYYQTSGGLFNFGARAGGTVYNSFGNFTDRSLIGLYNFIQGAEAPLMHEPTLLPGGGVTIAFTSQGGGGGSVSKWILQYDDNSGFTSPSYVESTGTSTLWLEPGRQYWFRAGGQNEATAPYGAVGAWSNVRTATMLSGGKILRSGSWVNAEPMIRDAGAWKPAKVKIRDNGLWVPAV